jgi:hypothetical protein
MNVRRAGDGLAVLYQLGDKDKSSWSTIYRLGFFDMKGAQQYVLIEARKRMNYAGARFVEADWSHFDQCWAASPDGRVFARSNSREYAISVWTAEGQLERIIHRDYPPHNRTREEGEQIKRRWGRRLVWLPKLNFEIEKSWAPVHDLYPRTDGTLWVRTSRGWRDPGEGIMAGFDVFDQEGHFVQQVEIQGDLDPNNDGLFLEDEVVFVVTDIVSAIASAKGGEVQELTSDENLEPISVICFRIPIDRIFSGACKASQRASQ